MRNYEREYQKSKEGSKTYNVRIPLYMANLLDDKLKKERANVRKYCKRSRGKILKKIKKYFYFILTIRVYVWYNIIKGRQKKVANGLKSCRIPPNATRKKYLLKSIFYFHYNIEKALFKSILKIFFEGGFYYVRF